MLGPKALGMQNRMVHGKRCEARRFIVLRSVCPASAADYVTIPRAIQHMMRGNWRCALAWRAGALVQFTDEQVVVADEQDRVQRAQARASGARPGVRMPDIPREIV